MRPIDGKPGFTIWKSPSSTYNDINLRLDMPPGDKTDFVLGMRSLVDREAIDAELDGRLGGRGAAERLHGGQCDRAQQDPSAVVAVVGEAASVSRIDRP